MAVKRDKRFSDEHKKLSMSLPDKLSVCGIDIFVHKKSCLFGAWLAWMTEKDSINDKSSSRVNCFYLVR